MRGEGMSEVVVRVVQQGDGAMLRDNCFTADTLEQVVERVQGYLNQYAAGECVPLVAEVDGLVVGFAVARREPHPLRRHRATLFDMVVCGEYQRRGIARRLVGALCEHVAELGVEIIETSARGGTAAEEVYRRIGFREYGRLPGGVVEPWGDRQVFDEAYFAMPVRQHA
jgi:ribosomal protein S18 acetylase RimI-like enzyme